MFHRIGFTSCLDEPISLHKKATNNTWLPAGKTLYFSTVLSMGSNAAPLPP